MRSTEVDVVIKNGAVLLRILQEAGNLRDVYKRQVFEMLYITMFFTPALLAARAMISAMRSVLPYMVP